MKRQVLIRISTVMAIVCILAMLPIVSVSAATVSITSATDGNNVALADSAAAAPVVDKAKVFTIVTTATANIELSILSNVDGATLSAADTDKIAYINQVNSGTGATTFTFTLRDGIADGTYVVAIGGEGVSAPVKKYFKIAPPAADKSITITACPTSVVAGGRVNISGAVTGFTSLTVTLLTSDDKPIAAMGSTTIRTDGTYTAMVVTNQGLAAGTYKVKVTNESDDSKAVIRTFQVTAAETSSLRRGDVASVNMSAIPDGDVTTSDYNVALNASVGNITLGGQARKNGDINGDDLINGLDVSEIFKKAIDPSYVYRF